MQFANDNAVARLRWIGSSGSMTSKVTRNEWRLRFQHGCSLVDDDDDIVDVVDTDRVLGFPPVETLDNDNACGSGRIVRGFGRRRRVGTVRHVCMSLVSLHERAIGSCVLHNGIVFIGFLIVTCFSNRSLQPRQLLRVA